MDYTLASKCWSNVAVSLSMMTFIFTGLSHLMELNTCWLLSSLSSFQVCEVCKILISSMDCSAGSWCSILCDSEAMPKCILLGKLLLEQRAHHCSTLMFKFCVLQLAFISELCGSAFSSWHLSLSLMYWSSVYKSPIYEEMSYHMIMQRLVDIGYPKVGAVAWVVLPRFSKGYCLLMQCHVR